MAQAPSDLNAKDTVRALQRSDFPHLCTIATRWADCDMYGHVNNVVYYAYFDTAVNQYLIEAGALTPGEGGDAIGLVVETGCQYFSSLTFPGDIQVGLSVAHVGRTSVRYRLGVFGPEDTTCAAAGHFVHVYVDPQTRRPVPLPERLQAVLERLR